MAGNIFNRYVWLADTINRAGKITFEEINRKWLRTDWSEGQNLPLRTFHNYRVRIEELFDINIECDNHDRHRYYIENKEDIELGGLRTWLLNTFAVNNLIHENYSLKERILFEEIPSGQRFLTAVIEAMRDELCIEINYHAFWMDEPILLKIKPFCVKIFRQRWYVIGENCSTNEIRRYALDRMLDARLTVETFKIPENFNFKEHFETSFGILLDSKIKPCIVKVKAFDNKRKYLKTLPLHASQKEIDANGEYAVFQYYISPTPDFVQELLAHGDEIEVLAPESLRNEIIQKIEKMSNRYKKFS